MGARKSLNLPEVYERIFSSGRICSGKSKTKTKESKEGIIVSCVLIELIVSMIFTTTQVGSYGFSIETPK